MENPRFIDLLRNPVQFLAFGFGTGLSPKAPGTVGSLVGIPLYLLLSHGSPWFYGGFVVVAFAAGVYWCGRAARELGVHDHGGIVWDEVVGMLITLFLVPVQWQWIALGFIYFRIFDIWKPWPIGWADRRLTGGLGIMVDDVFAGIYAVIVLHLSIYVISLAY